MKKFSFTIFLSVCIFLNPFIHEALSQVISTSLPTQEKKKSLKLNQQKTFESNLTSQNRDLATDKFTLTGKGFLDPSIQAIETTINPEEY
ncbi:hypothetical protein B6I21_08150, partial [candidate division KSB1 bacterium 4572_119]